MDREVLSPDIEPIKNIFELIEQRDQLIFKSLSNLVPTKKILGSISVTRLPLQVTRRSVGTFFHVYLVDRGVF